MPGTIWGAIGGGLRGAGGGRGKVPGTSLGGAWHLLGRVGVPDSDIEIEAAGVRHCDAARKIAGAEGGAGGAVGDG